MSSVQFGDLEPRYSGVVREQEIIVDWTGIFLFFLFWPVRLQEGFVF